MYKNIKVAFFDCDETLISFKSMFSFLKYYLIGKYHDSGCEIFNKYMIDVKSQWEKNIPREIINIDYYKQFKNENIDEVLSFCKNWIIDEKKNAGDDFYIKETINAINIYKEMGSKIVIVSGSLFELIQPIAMEVGANDILATRMTTMNKVFTGEIIPPQTIGAGKAEAVKRYLYKNNIPRECSIAWGDHESDFDMLNSTGKGVIISKDLSLLQKAEGYGFFTILRD
ncbi:HAD-IB family hydrolase [Salmonella enterica]|nr:HAD-IB family hydrolase [Salmonella enterica]EGY4703663.1 HAD-IB family hydrolase [Salmonella enterica]EHG4022809.1 HAD-IB family hydrolase [Salmonella enterica]EHK3106889.1 HAD-IB family hydrolase [Salmonella enterica]EJB9134471.1 HAD-IB family hydrolase [Salmonella enterica]